MTYYGRLVSGRREEPAQVGPRGEEVQQLLKTRRVEQQQCLASLLSHANESNPNELSVALGKFAL
jgi:aminoglycoside phosphotransferase family enzyme